MDYQTLYYLIKDQWEESVEENLDSFLSMIITDLEGLQVESLTEDQAKSLRALYPTLVKQITTARKILQNRFLFVQANKLLGLMVRDITVDLRKKPELLELLISVFKAEAFFDVRYKQANEKEQQTEVRGQFAELLDRERSFWSVFWAHHINTFGEFGGFEYLEEELGRTVSVKFIKNYLSFLVSIRGPLKREFLAKLIDRSYQAVFAKLSAFEEEQLKTVSKMDVQTIVNAIDALMKESRSYQESFISEKTENFCLDFSLKCFNSTFLEKRHHGLTYIEEAVQVLSRSYHIGYQSSFKWIQKGSLKEWILKNNLIEMLFDIKSTRDELIKRGKVIITFMAEESALTMDHFALIWQCAMDKYLSANSFEVLLSVGSINVLYTKAIYDKLVVLPAANWNAEMVKVIHALYFSTRTRAIRDLPSGGLAVKDFLDFYLKMVAPNSGLDPAIIPAFLDEIAQIMNDSAPKKKFAYCQDLIKGLQPDAPQGIFLCTKLIEDIRYSKETEQFILELDQESPLLALGIQSICDVKKHILKELQEEVEAKGGMAALDAYYRGGLFKYRTCLKYYLDFMSLVLEKTTVVSFTARDIAVLWETFLTGGGAKEIYSFAEEHTVIYEWLQRLGARLLAKKEARRGISKDNALLVFEHLCRGTSTLSSVQAFECLRTYFVAVNVEVVQLLGEALDGSVFVIANYPADGHYRGLKELLDITLKRSDEGTFKLLGEFLIRLFTRFTAKAKPDISKIHKNFVDLIMHRIFQLLKEARSDGNIQEINRCTFMLDQFLQATKTEPQYEPEKNEKASNESSNAGLQPRTESERMGMNNVMEFTGCSQVVALLALKKWNGMSHMAVQSILDNPELYLLEAEKYMNTDAAPQKGAGENSQYTSPRHFLSNEPSYFDCLLSLLDDERTSGLVWEIVNNLPPSRTIETSLHSLEHVANDAVVDYAKIFDSASTFKFLYTLQIIDTLLRPVAGSNNSNASSSTGTASSKSGDSTAAANNTTDDGNKENKAPTSAGQSTAAQPELEEGEISPLDGTVVNAAPNVTAADAAKQQQEPQTQQAASTNGAKGPNALAWCKKFRDTKGFVYLVSMIPQFDLANASKKANSQSNEACLLLIVKVVDLFVSQNLLQNIGEGVDFPYLVHQLLSIADHVVTKYAIGQGVSVAKSDQELLDYAMRLLASLIQSQPTLLSTFYSSPIDTKHFILKSLKRSSQEIASLCKREFLRICREWVPNTLTESEGVIENPITYFHELLVQNYPWEDAETADAYYDLIAHILILNGPLEKQESNLRLSRGENFFSQLMKAIQKSEGDRSENSEQRSTLLMGSLIVLSAYLKTNPNHKAKPVCYELVQRIFDICMSPNDEMISTLKCLTKETRKAAFDLLIELSTGNDRNYQLLISLLTPCIQIPTKDERAKMKNLAKTKRGEYVGLLNIGCTCYANSVMQQFYMIPSLRQGIFECTKTQEKMVLEVRKMFSFLQESKREFYDTQDFMNTMSDLLEIRQQQDAYEFFQHACDRLENQLKDDGKTQLLLDTFRGELSNEIVCSLNPEHRSRGQEYVYTLSVDVKKELHSSLHEFFAGEKIQNYNCDKCKRDVEITRGFAVRKLPTNLIIHLKRFKWSMDAGKKQKICDRFEYPLDLDMKRYMSPDAEQHEDEYYQYVLVGVIVHSGDAESGHYYSFIQDRATDKWHKFDDKMVSDFNIQNLPAETYGQKDEMEMRGGGMMWSTSSNMSARNKNAYMLVYEQVKHRNQWKKLLKETPVHCPTDVSDSIKADNSACIRLLLRFDSIYFDFLENVLNKLTFQPVLDSSCDENDFILQTLQKVTKFVFEMSSDFSEKQYVSWMTSLNKHYQKHAVACRWLLNLLCTTRKQDWLVKNLLESNERYARKCMEELIMTCIQVLDPIDAKIEYNGPFPSIGCVEKLERLGAYDKKVVPTPTSAGIVTAGGKTLLPRGKDVSTLFSTTKMTKYPHIFTHLERLSHALSDENGSETISTIAAIIMRILEDPTRERFRVLNLAKVDTIVSTFCISCLGFVTSDFNSTQGKVIILKNVNTELLTLTLESLTSLYKNSIPEKTAPFLKATESASPSTATAPTPTPTPTGPALSVSEEKAVTTDLPRGALAAEEIAARRKNLTITPVHPPSTSQPAQKPEVQPEVKPVPVVETAPVPEPAPEKTVAQPATTEAKPEGASAEAQKSPEQPAPVTNELEALAKENVGKRFICYLLSLAEDSRSYARKFSQYWHVLMRLFEMHHEMRAFLIRAKLDAIAIDQYMGENSPFWKDAPQCAQYRSRPNINNEGCQLEELMWVLSYTVSACHNTKSRTFPADHQPNRKWGGPMLEMMEYSNQMLHCYNNYAVIHSILYTSCYNPKANELLVYHLAWEEPKLSRYLLNLCADLMTKDPARAMLQMQQQAHMAAHMAHHVNMHATHFETQKLEKEAGIMNILLSIEDSLAHWRISSALSTDTGFLITIVLARSPHKQIAMLNLLKQWTLAYPLVAGYLLWMKDDVGDILERLSQIPSGKLSAEFQSNLEFFAQFLHGKTEVKSLPFPEKFFTPAQ